MIAEKFYNEKGISDLIRCPVCLMTLVAPKILPCCQKTVCMTCSKEIRQQATRSVSTTEMLCALCLAYSDSDHTLIDNITVQQLLQMQPKEVSRGKLAEQLQQCWNELSTKVQQMETSLTQDEDKIKEFCCTIRNEVDIELEKHRKSVEDFHSRFIADIDRYQTEAISKLNEIRTSKEMLDYKSFVEMSRKYSDNCSNVLADNVIDESVAESSVNDCRKMTANATNQLRWFNNAIFSNRLLRFVNGSFKIEKEAIGSLELHLDSQFCTHINKVSCIKTLSGNNRLQYVFGYLKTSDEAQFDYNNDRMAIGGTEDGCINIWSIGRNEHVGKLEGHKYFVNKTRHIGRERLLSCSNDNTIKLWNLVTFECIQTFCGHSSGVKYIEPLNDETFVSCSYDTTIRMWRFDRADCVHVFSGHTSPVDCVKLWQNKQLVSYSNDKTMKFWCVKSNMCLRTHTFNAVVSWIELLDGDGGDDQDRAALAFFDFSIQIWNLDQMQLVSTLNGHTNDIWWMKKLSKIFLISGSSDFSLKIWNLETSQCVCTLAEHKSVLCFLRILSRDLFMSCESDKVTKIWKIE